MASTKDITEGFNRYWLRYGPATAVAVVMLFRSFESIRSAVIEKPALGLGLLLVGCGAQYVSSWPPLLAHWARTDPDTRKKMAKTRDTIKNGYWHADLSQEHLDTLAHGREHGNAMYVAGSTFLHLGIFVLLYAGPTQPKFGLVSFWPGMMAIVIMTVGMVTWLKASAEEIETLDRNHDGTSKYPPNSTPDQPLSVISLFFPILVLGVWFLCLSLPTSWSR